MDAELRLAWTEIVTASDYEQHMAAIGQAQAAADLTHNLIRQLALPKDARIAIAGAGTGQMFEFLDGSLFQPYRLTFSDLNPAFLNRLQERIAPLELDATILVDDFEESLLPPGMDLLLGTLLFEHIEWERGVATVWRLRPHTFGVILQENPEGMTSAVTPGRVIPPSIAKATEVAHPVLVPRDHLIEAMAARRYACREVTCRSVADGKRLLALQFVCV